jgi:energy-converting hydrogenase Eha subunit E
MLRALVKYLNIELPTLDVFPSFLACDDNYELGNLAAHHPFV